MDNNLVSMIKDGKIIQTSESRLRQGDLVALQVGDNVPADLHLIEARGLEVDEFEITGELLPVRKEVEGTLYRGSKVVRRAGKGVVVAAGDQTEYGKVLKQSVEQRKPHTFQWFKRKYLVLVGLILPGYMIHLVQFKFDFFVTVFYLLLSFVLILLQNDDLFKNLRNFFRRAELPNCTEFIKNFDP